MNDVYFSVSYLMCRVLTCLNRCITMSFMMVGHTKFAPDWCFGLVKRRFRREKVNCVDDFARVVEASAEANVAELVGREDSAIYIPMCSWSTFLAPHFRRVPQLKYHHITISCEDPGTVSLKLATDCEEGHLQLLKDGWTPTSAELSVVIPPPGLSRERQWYLHDHISDYCTDQMKDIVCPRPAAPQANSPENGVNTTEGR